MKHARCVVISDRPWKFPSPRTHIRPTWYGTMTIPHTGKYVPFAIRKSIRRRIPFLGSLTAKPQKQSPEKNMRNVRCAGFAKPSVEIPATGITDPTDQNKPEQPNTPENPTGSTQNSDMQETNTATHTNTENKEILQNQQSTTAQTIPQTGDTNTFWLFTIFILLCISSATGVILGMKRKAFPKQKHTQFSTIKRDKQ